MLFDPPAAVRYDPSVETPEKDEEETARALNEQMAKIREKTLEDGGHPLRSVHAKSHVGRITAPPQTAWSEARSAIVDDGLSFSPWHGLAAHRPLGSIMRVRKASNEQSARLRQEKTGHATAEPREAVALPG